jgi:hypothetical protein
MDRVQASGLAMHLWRRTGSFIDFPERFADPKPQRWTPHYKRITATWLDIVREIATENEYKMVMSRTRLVLSHDSRGITGEVIQRLKNPGT